MLCIACIIQYITLLEMGGMAKTSGSQRTTISIPADIKRRMNNVKEDVNWSAIACRAFESKLAEIATRKERKTMQDVIDRLRESKRQSEGADHADGFVTGKDFAMHRAEAHELQALEALQRRTHDWDGYFTQPEGSGALGLADLLYLEIIPESEQNGRDGSAEFWDFAIGADVDRYRLSPTWLKGFAEGALDVWEDVKSKL